MNMKEEQEINKKRKGNDLDGEEEDNDLLALSLSYGSRMTTTTKVSLSKPPRMMPLPPQQQEPQQIVSQYQPSHPFYNAPFVPETSSSVPLAVMYPQEFVLSSPVVPGAGTSGPGPSRPIRVRRNHTQAPRREGKSETVPPPYPWATMHRATVHNINYLFSNGILTIAGDVQCKRCERRYEIAYDLKDKFAEIRSFIAESKNSMHDRAPPVWKNPVLPKCKLCGQKNSAKPVISDKKKSINWLFLLLGQMLGCCTLEQLKYFCKHTNNHRTGAKDRILYLTYLGLCKQLDPNGPFNR